MANPIKAPVYTRSSPETEPLNEPFKPSTAQMRQEQEKAQTGSTMLYVILAIVVLVGGYYLYATGSPSTAVTSTVTKTELAPTPNAAAGSGTAVPTAPPAAGSTAVDPSAPPPAANSAPASGTTKTP